MKLNVVLVVLLITCCMGHVWACSFKTASGKTIDLSSLDVPSTGYLVPGATDPNWKFFLNICGAVDNPNAATCKIDAQAYQYSSTYNLCNSMGKKAEPKISLLNPADENSGVKVLHAGISAGGDGVTRLFSVSLTCDKSATARPTLQFSGEPREGGVITYEFTGTSASACPGTAPPISGGDDLPLGQFGIGGLIMILCFIAFLLYFIIGSLIMKFKKQKTGLEIIPHVAFWKDVPFLFVDGVMLPVDLIKERVGKRSYQEV